MSQINESLRHKIYGRDNRICQVCLKHVDWDEFATGHLQARCYEGLEIEDNLITTHTKCNAKMPRFKTPQQAKLWLELTHATLQAKSGNGQTIVNITKLITLFIHNFPVGDPTLADDKWSNWINDYKTILKQMNDYIPNFYNDVIKDVGAVSKETEIIKTNIPENKNGCFDELLLNPQATIKHKSNATITNLDADPPLYTDRELIKLKENE